jgi:hypothetical protein
VPLDPLAPEEGARPPSAQSERSGHPATRAVFAVVALVFLMGPGLIILAGGAGQALPREQQAARPRPSEGWRFFYNTTRYVTQRLPLRDRAVDANNWISNHVFGEPPHYGTGALAGPDKALPFGGVNQASANGGYAQTGGARAQHPIVAVGRDGWFYLQGEIDTVCKPPVAFGAAVARWDRFLRIVRASGRNVVLVVAPEKSTIYPEHVDPKTVWWPCARLQKAVLWADIEALHNPDLIPLRRHLLSLKQRDPARLLYLPLDSHWNDVGALQLARAAVDHVGDGIRVLPQEVRFGTKRYAGDMAGLMGAAKKTGVAPSVAITRARDAVLPGPTLFLHDSYGDAAAPLIAPYAGSQLTIASFLTVDQSEIVQLLRRSRTAIVETVERDFLNRSAVGTEQQVLTPHFLDALPRALGPPPAG